jgi:uncharacterized integral membrane protein (TIGR00697 family)
MSNIVYQKFVSLSFMSYSIELSAGAILYPLTFLIMDIITELYGPNHAKFCIKIAMGINMLCAGILVFLDYLPAAAWSNIDDKSFHMMFGFYGIAYLGSMLACYLGQRLDVLIYSFLRMKTSGRHLWLRSSVSTGVSLFLDTVIIISTLSALGVLPQVSLWVLIRDSYRWKLLWSIMNIPCLYIMLAFIKSTILPQYKMHTVS